MSNRMIFGSCTAVLMGLLIVGCASTGSKPVPLPHAGQGLEALAADPFFEAVIGVRSAFGYRERLLTAPALYFREQSCVLEPGFRGRGEMWYLASASDQQWKRLDHQLEWPEGAETPVVNGKPLEDWWALAAIPEDDAVFIFQCADAETETRAPPADQPHVTTEADLAPNPKLPHRWYPFDEWPGDEDYSPYEAKDNLDLLGTAPEGCPTRVHAFDLYLAGKVRGSLSFNQRKRGGPSYAHSMNGGNTMLGGFQNYQTRINSWLAYKYQVEFRFLGPLKHAFFGQMVSDPQAFSFTDPAFHDDTPANDWPGKRWNLAPGDNKASFPVIEIVTLTNTDHIVRYIDAPGGGEIMGIGLSDKYMYVIIYAGVCGVVTDIKYLQLYYPDQFRWTDGTPRATEMTLEQFRDAVGDWSFSD